MCVCVGRGGGPHQSKKNMPVEKRGKICLLKRTFRAMHKKRTVTRVSKEVSLPTIREPHRAEALRCTTQQERGLLCEAWGRGGHAP